MKWGDDYVDKDVITRALEKLREASIEQTFRYQAYEHTEPLIVNMAWSMPNAFACLAQIAEPFGRIDELTPEDAPNPWRSHLLQMAPMLLGGYVAMAWLGMTKFEHHLEPSLLYAGSVPL